MPALARLAEGPAIFHKDRLVEAMRARASSGGGADEILSALHERCIAGE